MDESALREAYLRRIISRYASHINFQEQKSVTELKAMASPAGVAVLSEKLAKPLFADYAESCYSFVSDLENLHVLLPVSFWLTLDDILALRAGDAMDKSVLLLALLNARSAGAFARVVQLEDGLQHALVWFPLEDACWLMDPVHRVSLRAPSMDAVLAAYHATHPVRKSLYEFNDREYREL